MYFCYHTWVNRKRIGNIGVWWREQFFAHAEIVLREHMQTIAPTGAKP